MVSEGIALTIDGPSILVAMPIPCCAQQLDLADPASCGETDPREVLRAGRRAHLGALTRCQNGVSNPMTAEHCCLLGCARPQDQPDLPIGVWPPSDSPPVRLWAHAQCFEAARSPVVLPDEAQDRGHIPSKARCVFCGKPLPTVGHHPFALEVGAPPSPSLYWAHAECFNSRVQGLPLSANTSA
jgi:hypothetical protein